ncbi:hypothetical protein IE81DRAFT_320324 [Ceraceosorus guamensis]|uniref:DUF2470 domain-containing protein n=1 Tax=Ceraceosorus guamensis TaxID=1522189 RepID=A0A316W8Q6_9BASI|nr:hypothetical protein IE81DRAFT_320324 [Ceraceosorus guamensis]PWN45151.1 hypothetical protein IE81DRAFT_320324 [Ceraceosorus guamensis]
MSDIQARSSRILSHLNKDHKDSLRAIVAKAEGSVILPYDVKATSIDAKGFTAEYYIHQSLGSKPRRQVVKVDFPKPLEKADEARHVFVKLSDEASGLWYPVRFSAHPLLPGAVLIAGLLYLASKAYDIPAAQITFLPILQKYPDAPEIAEKIFKTLAGVHTVEAVLMLLYVLRKGGSLAVAIKWAVQQLFVGFPNFFGFKKINPTGPKDKNPAKLL